NLLMDGHHRSAGHPVGPDLVPALRPLLALARAPPPVHVEAVVSAERRHPDALRVALGWIDLVFGERGPPIAVGVRNDEFGKIELELRREVDIVPLPLSGSLLQTGDLQAASFEQTLDELGAEQVRLAVLKEALAAAGVLSLRLRTIDDLST